MLTTQRGMGLQMWTKTARRLAWIRTQAGKTPAEFAEMLGIEQALWSSFERAEQPIPLALAAKLANKYELTVAFIYRGIIVDLPKQSIEKLHSNLDWLKLIEPDGTA